MNILAWFQSVFTKTLRRRLIWSVAFIHAVMMALFVWDLTNRQKDILLDGQADRAIALAESIAASSAGWVAARDYFGLQEIIAAQSQYPELLFAMIVDDHGRILAHTDPSRAGQYLADLPTVSSPSLITKQANLVDAVSPIFLGETPVGWVRVGLGQKITAEKMASMVQDGLIYTLSAILIGSLIAWIMGTNLTRRLARIQHSAELITSGDISHRVDITGEDEVSRVADAFNSMLDSLAKSHQALRVSEERFNYAVSATDDGIWDWNLSTGAIYFSPKWKSMLGYQDDELANQFTSWERLLEPRDLKQIHALIDDCLNGKKNKFAIEFRMKHKRGHWINILSQGALIFDENNQPIRIVGRQTNITEQKEKQEAIWRQANYDSLTQLPNRNMFLDILPRELSLAQRNHQNVWVMFLDLDGFKEINDTLGHQNGDLLLRMVADRLKSALRQSDLLARLGGDEFVIILPGIETVTAIDTVANNVIRLFLNPFMLNDQNIHITTSIGIASYPSDAQSVSDLMKFADQSMYAAKNKGKSNYVYFTPELQKDAKARISLISALREAITAQQFELYYQPIINLKTNEIEKAEALIRWNHPEKGLISPYSFIPIAEETGLIVDLGQWVFEAALKQLQAWNNSFRTPIKICINVSPRQFKTKNENHFKWIEQLADRGIQGKDIVLEITEGLFLSKNKVVDKRLIQLRDAGIQVAIDDFGTGYSSLAYLKEFDIDYLKIDQSFVRKMQAHSSEEMISEAIVVMAHKLGLGVIAEGVEEPEQAQLLLNMGCDCAQGYLYSEPVPAGEFEKLMQQHCSQTMT